MPAAVPGCWTSPPAQSAAVPCIAYNIAQIQVRRRLLMPDRRLRAESLLLRRSSELRWIAVPIDSGLSSDRNTGRIPVDLNAENTQRFPPENAGS
jgi:hypothetical protein